MNIIGKFLFVLTLALATIGSGMPAAQIITPPVTRQTISVQTDVLFATMHDLYEGAWARAVEYTDLQSGEMPPFPEDSVHWMMNTETWVNDDDMDDSVWHTDLFRTGTSRVYAWYKAGPGTNIEHGVSLPVNARIEMLVTLPEILQYEHAVEGILAHEMIHYIHHMRVMNQKGWSTIWPGDGHNYMAYLKYVRGYDLPANKY